MQNIHDRFKGTGVALVTPFDRNGMIDEPGFGRLLKHIEEGGVDFLLALGTTAETATMDPEERRRTADLVRKYNFRNLPLMIGIGGNCTAELVSRIRNADLEGYDAILSVTPYYNKPSQEGLFSHFAAVAEASPVPVFLYNVPGRTGVDMHPETVARLAEEYKGRIAGIKEASGTPNNTTEIRKLTGKDFLILSGDDNLTPQLARHGAEGVISVTANAFPAKVKSMMDRLLAGDCESAERILEETYAVTQLLFREGNPVGIKAMLSIMGIIGNNLRLPLVPASGKLTEDLRKASEGLC